MADGTWNKGRLVRVLHPVGKFPNGDARYRRANYDLLYSDINGDGIEEQYILTPPADYQGKDTETIQSAVQEHEIGNEYGFYEAEAFIVDVNGFHDVESWPYLHVFGHV